MRIQVECRNLQCTYEKLNWSRGAYMMRLETERLLIREIVENDWRHIHTYTSLPEITEHTAWGPNTEEDTRAYVQDVIRMRQTEPREGYELAIVLKKKAFSSVALGSTLWIRLTPRSAMFCIPRIRGMDMLRKHAVHCFTLDSGNLAFTAFLPNAALKILPPSESWNASGCGVKVYCGSIGSIKACIMTPCSIPFWIGS